MGFLQNLMQLLRRQPKNESLAIASKQNEALEQRSESLEALQKRFESLSKAPQALESAQAIQSAPLVEETSSIELQKDSIQLGLAAGYTGRTLKEIESSLTRIESQVVTKDWFLSQFEDRTPELLDLFRKHDENEQKRFEAIQTLLISLQQVAEKAPEPVRTELFQEIDAIEHQLPLTPKMNELLSIVKNSKEISYDDLHTKLNITVSALRGLLANMTKRTIQIERFEKDSKGWVRYTGI